MRVLLIEDDKSICLFLRVALEHHGYDVAEAHDGWTGMQIFHQKPFDIVITDIFMPGKAGLDVIDELREEFPATKTLAISGGGVFEMEYTLELAKALGADRYLSKPFTPEQVLEILEEFTAEIRARNITAKPSPARPEEPVAKESAAE